MKFKNHIGYRFLTDKYFAMEALNKKLPLIMNKINKSETLSEEEAQVFNTNFVLINTERRKTKAFFVTNTVFEKLEMLKVKKNPIFDWTVFKNIPVGTDYTFLFDSNNDLQNKVVYDSSLLRIVNNGVNGSLGFMHVGFRFNERNGTDNRGKAIFTGFWVNRISGKQSRDFETSQEVKDLEEYTYKLLCFIFLSENEFQIVQPGQKQGTKKSGKILNDLPVPITIINSKWNVTSIRTEGFGVVGHFALRWCGEGRKISKMVFIEPYVKKGYIRRAANESIKS